VGTQDDIMVAIGALKRITLTVAEITRMRVKPQFWRRGFGQAILNELEDSARTLGYRILCLDTTVQQIAAQKLYSKNGYREVGSMLLGDFESIVMVKELLPTGDAP
jgi:GNAT superfamily N-acetyltransferase